MRQKEWGRLMDLKQFSNNVMIIAENFGFKIENPEWIKILFSMSDKFSDQSLKFGFRKMCEITKEEWQKKYGFNSKPAFADWINFFTLKDRLEFEEKKKIEEKALYLNAKRNLVEKVERYYETDDHIVNKRLMMILGHDFNNDGENIKMIDQKEVKNLLSNLTQKL